MESKPWHPEAIPAGVTETMLRLARLEALAGFYLAGGTALALHYGHRISRDLDFCMELFDAERLLAQIQAHLTVSVFSMERQTLHLDISGTKVSLLGYPYPLLFPLSDFRGISVADPRDIACMKLAAVGGRGSKRDFVDLYVLANDFGMPGLLGWFKSKYARVNFSLIHVLKSLTYFEDAELEPMPHMLAEVSWEEVKAYFLGAAPGLI